MFFASIQILYYVIKIIPYSIFCSGQVDIFRRSNLITSISLCCKSIAQHVHGRRGADTILYRHAYSHWISYRMQLFRLNYNQAKDFQKKIQVWVF